MRIRDIEYKLKKLEEWYKKGLITSYSWENRSNDLIRAWTAFTIKKINKSK